MNALPYLAGLATRHEWARREYARLQADLVEARLAAAARTAAGPGARLRDRLRGRLREGVSGRLGAVRRSVRPARPVRPAPASQVPGCRRAAARSFQTARTAGGTR